MSLREEPDLRGEVQGGGSDTLGAPPPDFTLEEAGELARRLFGVSGSPSPLDSERDQNIRIHRARGSFVLKIANAREEAGTIDLQVKAMLHAAQTDAALPIPRVRATSDGRRYAVVERNAQRYLVHMVTFLEGEEVDPADLDIAALHDFGATVARMGKALRGFFHPAAARILLWDVKQAARLRPLLGQLEDGARSALVERALQGFEERVLPVLPRLRAQVVHGDLTLGNVRFGAHGRPTAIIDFGDVVHTALVCDLAVALAALLRGGESTFDTAEEILRGYGTVAPLEDEEAAVLADAIAARLAATVVISAWRARRFPENAEYITAFDAGSWPVLELFDELGADEVARRVRRLSSPALAWRPPASRGSSTRSTAELVARRRRVLGSALLPLSYDRPVHVLRAEGVWMYGSDGQRYLDAYNNVPAVGHSHPRVVEAVANQARLVNTNTRYLHEAALELAERLTATMPDGLDTCLFVNSGSEANDLAWRIASTVTGGSGGIASAWAYHGITAALTDLSPSEWREQPAHIETVSPPGRRRRGRSRHEPGDASYAVDVEKAAAALCGRGYPPAAMILDAAWTSDGIFTDTVEVLPEAIRRVREAGGLFVADEIQAGFGRLGSRFWSFEPSPLAPDLVTLGKPMGNGHPVAAVVTRREIADAFARRRRPVFSTFGGNPVACASALAVLDVIEEEGLAASAAEVGEYLGSGLDELARRHALVEEVRGEGLLIGVELVSDPETREPATQAARAVVNGMRERGVLIGTTGRDDNVLKIRPPLPFGREHADLLLATLGGVLADTEASRRG